VLLARTTSLNGKSNGHSDHESAEQHSPTHAHRHFPVLTYWLKDLTQRSNTDHRIVAAPNGQAIARRKLEGRNDLRLEPPLGSPMLSTARRPNHSAFPPHPVPRSRAEETWLDWTLSFALLDNSNVGIQAAALGLTPRQAAATITLEHGRLEAGEVVRGPNGKYVEWEFRERGNGGAGARTTQALAAMIILRLRDLEAPVRILGLEGLVEFAPSRPLWSEDRPVVQVSITNLPEREMNGIQPSHLSRVFDLVPRQPGPIPAIRFPEAAELIDTPGSTLCPPVTNR
jgi:hypothetical protein